MPPIIKLLAFTFAAAMLLVHPTNGADASKTPHPPNVLVIYTDDQGTLDANCYGSKDLITPTFDRLAASGIRFTQMYSPSAICSASRAGLMTGRMPARAGVPANVSSTRGTAGMPSSEVTIAEMLQKAGYRTGHVGKWHLGYTPETMPLGQGFQSSFGHMGGCIDNYSHFFYWYGPNRHDLWRDGKEVWEDGKYFGDSMVEEMKRLIDQWSDERFFIYWAINWPHYPLQGTEKWRAKYAHLPSPRNKYAAFVSSMDERIGFVIDHLEAKGLRENTLIILQSDHGHSVEERTFGGGGNPGPYRGAKGCLFEAGIRVPSICSWPGHIPQGETRSQMACGMDWMPTIAELTQTTLPQKRLDGKSLATVLQDATAESPHQVLYWQLGNGPTAQWALRSGDWKLLGNPKDTREPASIAKDEKLFLANLAQDKTESRNLKRVAPNEVKRLVEIQKKFASEL